MDPDINRREQLGLARLIVQGYEVDDETGIDPEDAYRLAELVLALDEWIIRGGSLPERWRKS